MKMKNMECVTPGTVSSGVTTPLRGLISTHGLVFQQSQYQLLQKMIPYCCTTVPVRTNSKLIVLVSTTYLPGLFSPENYYQVYVPQAYPTNFGCITATAVIYSSCMYTNIRVRTV